MLVCEFEPAARPVARCDAQGKVRVRPVLAGRAGPPRVPKPVQGSSVQHIGSGLVNSDEFWLANSLRVVSSSSSSSWWIDRHDHCIPVLKGTDSG